MLAVPCSCRNQLQIASTSLNPAAGFFSCSICDELLGYRTNCFLSKLGASFAMSWDPVFRFVKQIPRGRVLTYGALARALRLRGGARTAGRAMGATPRGQGIPGPRVLGANGKILIREPYASLQKKLLESEGMPVVESRINIKKYLWTPPRKK